MKTPWDNRNGWLGVKHQITYLLTQTWKVIYVIKSAGWVVFKLFVVRWILSNHIDVTFAVGWHLNTQYLCSKKIHVLKVLTPCAVNLVREMASSVLCFIFEQWDWHSIFFVRHCPSFKFSHICIYEVDGSRSWNWSDWAQHSPGAVVNELLSQKVANWKWN